MGRTRHSTGVHFQRSRGYTSSGAESTWPPCEDHNTEACAGEGLQAGTPRAPVPWTRVAQDTIRSRLLCDKKAAAEEEVAEFGRLHTGG